MINHVYQLVSPHVFSISCQDVNAAGQVLVRPRYMAVCHADQRYYQGLRDAQVLRKKLPMALIHECCGEVLRDASGKFHTGERVVLIPNVPGQDDDMIFENYARGSHFLSSGYDGFMREVVGLPADRVVSCEGVPSSVAAITEFVSVAVHSATRLKLLAHSRRNDIGIWGDGSLAYVMACVLRRLLPDAKITVVGKNPRKLSSFTFVHRVCMADRLPGDFSLDHAFECAGGEGSGRAIDDIITCIRPQGTVMLMGVSENPVPVRTRDVLEKGLTLVGSSRSGRQDFETAVELMQDKTLQNRLGYIIYEDKPVRCIKDIQRIFETDMTTPFKTVFRWDL